MEAVGKDVEAFVLALAGGMVTSSITSLYVLWSTGSSRLPYMSVFAVQ